MKQHLKNYNTSISSFCLIVGIALTFGSCANVKRMTESHETLTVEKVVHDTIRTTDIIREVERVFVDRIIKEDTDISTRQTFYDSLGRITSILEVENKSKQETIEELTRTNEELRIRTQEQTTAVDSVSSSNKEVIQEETKKGLGTFASGLFSFIIGIVCMLTVVILFRTKE